MEGILKLEGHLCLLHFLGKVATRRFGVGCSRRRNFFARVLRRDAPSARGIGLARSCRHQRRLGNAFRLPELGQALGNVGLRVRRHDESALSVGKAKALELATPVPAGAPPLSRLAAILAQAARPRLVLVGVGRGCVPAGGSEKAHRRPRPRKTTPSPRSRHVIRSI